MKREKRFWLYLFLLLCFSIIWFVIENYANLTLADRITLVFIFGLSFPVGCAILTIELSVINKKKILVRVKKKAGSKPFEYLFFIFLFIASYYTTWLVQNLGNIDMLVNNFFAALLLGVSFSAALVCGWLHYVEAIHS